MKEWKKPAAIHRPEDGPAPAGRGQAGALVSRVTEPMPAPERIHVPAGRVAAQAKKGAGRFILYEKRGSLGIITARVHNVGEVYDEIDSLLDEIELDGDIRTIAIYTLNGLFASLPIR